MAPEISVVIPTHDRREPLRACLESLAKQTIPPGEFEVVVVAARPTDSTEAMLAELSVPFELRVLPRPQSGSSAARNRGVDAARGRFVLLLDDDMVASPGLVAAHVKAQRAEEGIAGIGPIERRLPSRPDRIVRHRAEAEQAHYEALRHRPAALRDVRSGNLSLERSRYLGVGGFATDIPVYRDIEFAYRLAEAGATFRYVEDARVAEDDGGDWRSIVDDQRLRGRISIELYRRHPGLLPLLPIGGTGEIARKIRVLRELALALHISPVALGGIGVVLPGRLGAGWPHVVESCAYWAGVRSAADRETWRRLRRGVLILMYHGIGARGERPSRYVVPVDRFGREMWWLRRLGYHVISLVEYLRLRSRFELAPSKAVVITFDDGYLDNLTLARPVLERLGLPATVFLVSMAGETNTWSTTDGVAGRPLMSLENARSALGGVISFGAHTRTHPKLPDIRTADAEREVVGSRRELEAALGAPITTFAYPYGRMSPDVREIVVDAGFAGACSVRPGRNRPSVDDFALRRVEVYGTYRLPRFAATVWLGDLRLRRRERRA